MLSWRSCSRRVSLPGRETWAMRRRTGRALALLVVARLLVRRARFSSWRAHLGLAGTADRAQALEARQLGRHVERAASRLPGTSKCLPQAMALSWMLRARQIPHQVALMVRPMAARGGLDDLHAMVRCGDQIVLGNISGPWIETLVLPFKVW